MDKYFIEIEFKSTFENTYWLPLFIEANSEDDANETYQRILTGIKEHYEIKRSSEPKPYKLGINSNFIDKYIDNRMTGKLETLELNQWNIKNVETETEINFNQSLNMIDLDEKMSDTEVAKTLSRDIFPIKVIHKNEDLEDIEEFLLINVVAPKFINKLIGAFKNRKI